MTDDVLPFTGWEVDPDWASVDASTFGPFVACLAPLPRIEAGLVEFDTAACDAYSVRAPIPRALAPGDRLEVVMSHSILDAPSLAQGRMLLRLDGEQVWAWEKSIPSAADAIAVRLDVSRFIDAGAWLGVHVSNHGANQWRLVSIERIPAR